MKTLIIGLGNTLQGNDAAGILTIELLDDVVIPELVQQVKPCEIDRTG